jgi:hypothetical protein
MPRPSSDHNIWQLSPRLSLANAPLARWARLALGSAWRLVRLRGTLQPVPYDLVTARRRIVLAYLIVRLCHGPNHSRRTNSATSYLRRRDLPNQAHLDGNRNDTTTVAPSRSSGPIAIPLIASCPLRIRLLQSNDLRHARGLPNVKGTKDFDYRRGTRHRNGNGAGA